MDTLADTLWQEFAVETEEHLQDAESILARSDLQQVGVADIAQLFRSFHSIKGLARAMDVHGMEGVAHQSENLLGLVRDGRASLTVDLADLLLQAVDALKQLRDAVADRREDRPADPGLLSRLAAAFAEAGGETAPEAARAAAAAAIAVPDTPLHEDPEMLGIFVEVVRTLGPELCGALAGEVDERRSANDAAESLAHAAEVMNFDALCTAFGGLRDILQPLVYAGQLDDAARQDLTARLAETRLQIELLAELSGHDAGAEAFSAALAQRIGGERDRLGLVLVALGRSLRQNLAEGEVLAAEADAAALVRSARSLRIVAAALRQKRSAEILVLAEDICARLASGDLRLSEAIVETVDLAVAEIAASGLDDLADADADRIAAELRNLTRSGAQKALASGERVVAGLHLPDPLLAILSDENIAALQRGIGQRMLAYEVLVHLEADPDTARRWTAWLTEAAQSITNRTVLHGRESWFEALLLTHLPPAALLDALRVLDPERHCIKRVRRLTDAPGGETLLDELPPGPSGNTAAPFGASSAPQNMIRVRGELIDALLDDIGEFRAMAAGLRHLIRGVGSREIMARSRALAARLPAELSNEFLALVRDARERDRRLLETEDIIAGMLSRLHQSALELRVVPVDAVFNRLPRIVRDLAQHQGKPVDLVLEGRDVRIDKSMVDALADPLIHMVRNAVDHGIEGPEERRIAGKPERARVTVRAAQHGPVIHIEIGDDGRGLDAEAIRGKAVARRLLSPGDADNLSDEQAYRLIFEPGLSTAAVVTETSGRGVGMDVVLTTVRRLDGDVAIRSEPGRGTTFSLVLPVSAALQTALIVHVGDQSLAIPERHVLAVAEIETDAIRLIGNHRSILHRQAVLPLYGLGELLGMTAAQPGEGRLIEPIVVTTNGRQMIGLEVDAIEQRQELFLKDLDPRLASYPGVGGASVLGDGRVVLVLDGEELIQLAARGIEPAPAPSETVH
jgi:chemotaxis protein histidine kinase CheA